VRAGSYSPISLYWLFLSQPSLCRQRSRDLATRETRAIKIANMMRRVARLILATLSAHLPFLCKRSPPRLILEKNIAQRLTVSVALAGAAISEPGRTAAPPCPLWVNSGHRHGSARCPLCPPKADIRYGDRSPSRRSFAKGCLNDGRRLRSSVERYSHSECPARHLMGRPAGVGWSEPPGANPRDQDQDQDLW